LGAWVNARVYAYGHSAENFALIANQLKPLLKHFEESGCIGSISEIFDGESPHKPQGCVAQAWSVAELLRIFKDYPQVLAALDQTSSNPIA
jgi:glycogen debranching enzyme